MGEDVGTGDSGSTDPNAPTRRGAKGTRAIDTQGVTGDIEFVGAGAPRAATPTGAGGNGGDSGQRTSRDQRSSPAKNVGAKTTGTDRRVDISSKKSEQARVKQDRRRVRLSSTRPRRTSIRVDFSQRQRDKQTRSGISVGGA